MWRWCAPPTGRRGFRPKSQPFLYDMGRQLATADLIVCRAGATTLAEITAAGKAAILIPLPTATDDHQRKNAEALAAAGAAEVLLQRDADRRRRWPRACWRWRRSGAAEAIAAAARVLARPDAARVIVDRALELAATLVTLDAGFGGSGSLSRGFRSSSGLSRTQHRLNLR